MYINIIGKSMCPKNNCPKVVYCHMSISIRFKGFDHAGQPDGFILSTTFSDTFCKS